MNRLKYIFYIFALAIVIIAGTGNQRAYAVEKDQEPRICKGVFIDRIEVSGMTKSEAKAAVNDLIMELQSKQVAILVNNNVITATMKELGYRAEPNRFVEQALGLATQGNLIKRYKDSKDIEQGTIQYNLTFKYDEERVRKLIADKAPIYNVAPVNATFSRENGTFIYTDHINGSKVDVEQTIELLKNSIENWNRLDIILNAVMLDDTPAFTREKLEASNTVLGEFSTEYTSSVEGRAANLANGAKLTNNVVLFPGDVFSSLDLLVPFTEGNGYYQAISYLNGKIVESIGGGACQVTTTLYNAVLFAELEIVERSSHSMTVSYVPLAMDAAVAEGSKDFKFRNNLDYPVIVEAFSKDRTITFRIWGHEERDTAKRKLQFVSKTIKEIYPPADKITKDSSKPTTYRKVTQKARMGYHAELYKVVYIDGRETERVLINKSYYGAEPNHVIVGTKPVKNSKPKG